jgi:phage gp36-like protein
MPYATLPDLEARYMERDLRLVTDPNAQAVDAVRAQQALNDAHAEADGWIGQRYVLPLTHAIDLSPLPAPSVLVRLVCDVAIYRLQTLRAADDVKDARRRYEDALKALELMANGRVRIPLAKLLSGVAEQGDSTGASAGAAQFTQTAQVFSRGNR